MTEYQKAVKVVRAVMRAIAQQTEPERAELFAELRVTLLAAADGRAR